MSVTIDTLYDNRVANSEFKASVWYSLLPYAETVLSKCDTLTDKERFWLEHMIQTEAFARLICDMEINREARYKLHTSPHLSDDVNNAIKAEHTRLGLAYSTMKSGIKQICKWHHFIPHVNSPRVCTTCASVESVAPPRPVANSKDDL
jgi:hypothetical protein